VTLIVRPAAAADIDEAWLWYEAHRHGLGQEFLDAVEQAFRTVAEMPTRYRVMRGGVRRALVRRFPYSVFFRMVGQDIVVLGCFHGRRDPRRWKERR
jgi:plasmid stabilization system protein ParE